MERRILRVWSWMKLSSIQQRQKQCTNPWVDYSFDTRLTSPMPDSLHGSSSRYKALTIKFYVLQLFVVGATLATFRWHKLLFYRLWIEPTTTTPGTFTWILARDFCICWHWSPVRRFSRYSTSTMRLQEVVLWKSLPSRHRERISVEEPFLCECFAFVSYPKLCHMA